jgi:hypothetical protein
LLLLYRLPAPSLIARLWLADSSFWERGGLVRQGFLTKEVDIEHLKVVGEAPLLSLIVLASNRDARVVGLDVPSS